MQKGGVKVRDQSFQVGVLAATVFECHEAFRGPGMISEEAMNVVTYFSVQKVLSGW